MLRRAVRFMFILSLVVVTLWIAIQFCLMYISSPLILQDWPFDIFFPVLLLAIFIRVSVAIASRQKNKAVLSVVLVALFFVFAYGYYIGSVAKGFIFGGCIYADYDLFSPIFFLAVSTGVVVKSTLTIKRVKIKSPKSKVMLSVMLVAVFSGLAGGHYAGKTLELYLFGNEDTYIKSYFTWHPDTGYYEYEPYGLFLIGNEEEVFLVGGTIYEHIRYLEEEEQQGG